MEKLKCNRYIILIMKSTTTGQVQIDSLICISHSWYVPQKRYKPFNIYLFFERHQMKKHFHTPNLAVQFVAFKICQVPFEYYKKTF